MQFLTCKKIGQFWNRFVGVERIHNRICRKKYVESTFFRKRAKRMWRRRAGRETKSEINFRLSEMLYTGTDEIQMSKIFDFHVMCNAFFSENHSNLANTK